MQILKRLKSLKQKLDSVFVIDGMAGQASKGQILHDQETSLF